MDEHHGRGALSYTALHQFGVRVAAAIQRHGIGVGDTVAVLAANSTTYADGRRSARGRSRNDFGIGKPIGEVAMITHGSAA